MKERIVLLRAEEGPSLGALASRRALVVARDLMIEAGPIHVVSDGRVVGSIDDVALADNGLTLYGEFRS